MRSSVHRQEQRVLTTPRSPPAPQAISRIWMLPVTWLEHQANTNPVHTTGADGNVRGGANAVGRGELRNERVASFGNGLSEQGGKPLLATPPQSDPILQGFVMRQNAVSRRTPRPGFKADISPFRFSSKRCERHSYAGNLVMLCGTPAPVKYERRKVTAMNSHRSFDVNAANALAHARRLPPPWRIISNRHTCRPCYFTIQSYLRNVGRFTPGPFKPLRQSLGLREPLPGVGSPQDLPAP
jgi:hypothetical protein